MTSDTIRRDRRGRIRAGGLSLNPKGRPKTPRRKFTSGQLLEEHLQIFAEPINVVVNGRTVAMPASAVLLRSAIQSAVEGQKPTLIRSLLEYHKTLLAARTEEVGFMFQWAIEILDTYRGKDMPDHIRDQLCDVLDRLKDAEYKPS
jgi:hypothetical protein